MKTSARGQREAVVPQRKLSSKEIPITLRTRIRHLPTPCLWVNLPLADDDYDSVFGDDSPGATGDGYANAYRDLSPSSYTADDPTPSPYVADDDAHVDDDVVHDDDSPSSYNYILESPLFAADDPTPPLFATDTDDGNSQSSADSGNANESEDTDLTRSSDTAAGRRATVDVGLKAATVLSGVFGLFLYTPLFS